jgi:RNA polymerase sigma-70 factor (ECF subfamily)
VRDWGDHPAWAEFYDQYNPIQRRWSGRFSPDADTTDELCQRIWMELMARMQTFRYDPSRGFRKWLWRLVRSRAIDLLRQLRATQVASYEDLPPRALPHLPDREPSDAREPQGPAASLVLVLQTEEAQAAVRARVDADTWRAHWMVAIEDRPIREAAAIRGKSCTAVYTRYKHVDRMLPAEGEGRLVAEDPHPGSGPSRRASAVNSRIAAYSRRNRGVSVKWVAGSWSLDRPPPHPRVSAGGRCRPRCRAVRAAARDPAGLRLRPR